MAAMVRRLRSFGLLLGLLCVVAAAPPAAAAGPRLVYVSQVAYDTLDPHVMIDSGRMAVRLNLYDGLMRWVDNPARLEPWLAERFTISETGLTYTFELRKGARFHDGSPVKASDVVYSMERILALKQGPYGLFAGLVAPGSTRIAGEDKVEFNLIRPSAVFLAILPEVHIVNTALVKSHEINNDWGEGWLARNDAGSGGYKLQSFDPAKSFVIERFGEHWNTKWGAKPIGEIEFQTEADLETLVAGLIDGRFHATDGYLPPDYVKRLREAPTVTVHEAETMRLLHAAIHNGREPMNDPEFRKVLSYAFDYNGFNKGILADSVVRNPGPLPNTIWGASKALTGYSYDLDKARQHLARKKQPPREITIGAIAGFRQTELAAALLRTGLDKIGVKARLVTEPWPVVRERIRDEKRMYDVLFVWKSATYADPHNWIGEMFACDQIGSRNISWYCNREVDKLLGEALATTDHAARRKSYEKAAAIVLEDAAGIFVSNAKWLGPFSKKVTSLRFCPVGDAQDMRWASMEP